MMKKSASVLVLCFLILSLVGSPVVSAGSISPTPPAPTAPDVVITSIVGGSVVGSVLDDVEIFNQTDKPLYLAGWQLAFTVSGCSLADPIYIPIPAGWILPKHYLNFERAAAPASPADFSVLFSFPDLNIFAGCTLASVQLVKDGQPEQIVAIPGLSTVSVQHKQRGNAPSSARTISGDFATDYPKPAGDLYGDPLYLPPTSDSGLQIVEILPHSRNCAPDDTTSPDCDDYIKLYNPTTAAIDLSQYRLRVGYKGQSTSITNTFHFDRTLEPGKYFALSARDDGDPLSLTDSGNYVWLEDAEGTTAYGSIMHYPDASSTTKVSHAWAFDGTTWRWTSAPHPFDANYFPPETTTPPKNSTPTYVPCQPHQYRSPDTHRCRNIVVSANTLVPCKPTQIRNPDTNRCRSILAPSANLKPCKSDQIRNPETNRCKAAVSASNSLKPCQAGWSRNPETNRCRKGSVLGSTTTKVQDVKSPITANNTRWVLASVIVVSALAYGMYEWRQELALKLAGVSGTLSRITRAKR